MKNLLIVGLVSLFLMAGCAGGSKVVAPVPTPDKVKGKKIYRLVAVKADSTKVIIGQFK